MLGLTFGCNNSIYFSTNAFLPDYLSSQGRADLIGLGLGWLNGAQFLATFILMVAAERLAGRTWPYLRVRADDDRAVLGITSPRAVGGRGAAGVGFSTAMTFALMLALPPQTERARRRPSHRRRHVHHQLHARP